jgi:pyridoxal phosphate enzyme (YggS family)
VVELITGLQTERIRANLAEVRDRVAQAAQQADRDPATVKILAATKYVPVAEMPKLADAGVGLVGENRAQDLLEKVRLHGERFTWHFIGQLQSRKVRLIAPHVSLIHSVASESALSELARHRELADPALEILIEVNVAGEPGKSGVSPDQLDRFIERSPVAVAGLMGMPPLTANPEDSRRWFAALAALARARGLRELSMGTSQDYEVAVAEGASIVRIGTRLYV